MPGRFRTLAILAATLLTSGASHALGQGITAAALDQRSLPELQRDRDRIDRLIRDIEDGNTYVVDPTLAFEGTTSGNLLRLPVPVDRDDLTWTITASMLEEGAPGGGAIQDYVRSLLRSNRETVERLGTALRQFDDAIRRKESGLQPRLARETRFNPADPESVEAYLNTTWRLQVQNAYGEIHMGDIRIEYVLCEPPDDVVPAVWCEFNGLLSVPGGGTWPVQNGRYEGGDIRMLLYAQGATVTMQGALSAESGDMTGGSLRVVGPAAAELAELGVRADGTWRASR